MLRSMHAPLVLLAVLVAACGPTELPTPSAETAESLIQASFPGSTLRVRQVDRTEEGLRVPAEFNGADVTFVLRREEGNWEIGYVEQGGLSYTVEQLGQIAATIETMSTLSDALEAYHAAEGAYPTLDDQVGLHELVPDYYQHPLDELLMDAWNSPLRYRFQGEDYTMTSTGPDTQFGTPDDITLVTGRFAGR